MAPEAIVLNLLRSTKQTFQRRKGLAKLYSSSALEERLKESDHAATSFHRSLKSFGRSHDPSLDEGIREQLFL